MKTATIVYNSSYTRPWGPYYGLKTLLENESMAFINTIDWPSKVLDLKVKTLQGELEEPYRLLSKPFDYQFTLEELPR